MLLNRDEWHWGFRSREYSVSRVSRTAAGWIQARMVNPMIQNWPFEEAGDAGGNQAVGISALVTATVQAFRGKLRFLCLFMIVDRLLSEDFR
jgi:hypothetical protein